MDLVPVPAGDTGDGVPAHLAGARVSATERTASGSRAVNGARARAARAGRIYVEGAHGEQLIDFVTASD